MAIVDALDAATGEYLFSMDAGLQNIVASIDSETGIKTIKSEAMPKTGSTFLVSPNHFGPRSWPSTSYNPQTHRLFVGLNEGAQIVSERERGWRNRLNPSSRDGTLGRLQAFDISRQELAWRYDVAAPLVSSVLATGGGLVFSADLNRTLRAFDEQNGEVLWQTELDDIPNCNIVTYTAGGKQYVALVLGLVSDNAEDWEGTYREYASQLDIPFNDLPKGGAAIWAFALDRQWQVEDLAGSLTKVDQSRSMENGRRLFTSASCKSCHALDNTSSRTAFGPSLRDTRSRIQSGELSRLELLTEILDPSQVVHNKYRTQTILTDSGETHSGIVVHEDDELVRIVSNPQSRESTREVPRDEIEQRTNSPVSLMPQNLLNTMTEEDILDLLAFIESDERP